MKQSTAWLVTCAMGASMVLALAAVIGSDNIEAVLNLGQQPPAAARPDRGREAAQAETKPESTGSFTDGANRSAGTREPQRDPETAGPAAPQPDGVAQKPMDEPGQEAQLREPDRPEPAQQALPRESEPLEPKAASETKTVQAEPEPARPAEPARPMPRVENAPPEAPARSEPPQALPNFERQALPSPPEPLESKSASETQPTHAEREPARQDEPAPQVTQIERAPPDTPSSADQQAMPSQPEPAESKPNSASESQPAHAEREPARQDEPAPPVTQAERTPPEAPAKPEPQTVLRETAPPEAKAEPASENSKINAHEVRTREVSTPAPAEILPTPETRAATPSEPSEPSATAITADSPNAAGIKSGAMAAPVEAAPRESSATLQRPVTEVRPADARKLRAAKRHKKSFKRKANRQKAYRRAYARARPADAGAWAAPPHYHQWGANPTGPRRCHIAYVPYGETWYRVRTCR